jgi:hypothetical protein
MTEDYFHSQLVFGFEVTMFLGDIGCTLSAFAWRMRGCRDPYTTILL